LNILCFHLFNKWKFRKTSKQGFYFVERTLIAKEFSMKNTIKLIGNIVIIPIFIFCLIFISCKGKTNAQGIFAPKADPETDFEARPLDGGKGVEITEYLGDKWEIVIPSKIRDLPVISIGGSAFYEKSLIKVTIPSSVTEIGDGAFSGAFSSNQLTSVTIPNGVTYIGGRAFSSNQLTSVTIPNSVTEIGGSAFSGNQLTSVTIPNSVTYIGEWAFIGNQLTSVTIPDSVTEIGGRAFSSNQLTSVTIGNSVTEIGEKAFEFNQLTSVTIGNSVTEIGENAFFGNQLTSITIPNSVTEIGRGAFDRNQLTSITIGANVDTNYIFLDDNEGFDYAYYNGGKLAGTYTRPNTDSATWARQ
jgi:hypothetical protein